jgi:glycerol-3-phosphate acyltransferase PlsY
MRLAGLALFTCLAGSLNFAILLLKLLGKEDPRLTFSGNAGTTNVFRQAGRGWAAVVLLLDVGRAAALALLAQAMLPAGQAPWIGLALVAANRYPLFHGFRGGKGVAGYLGFVLAIAPVWAVASCLTWVVVHRIVRLPFIASFAMIAILGAGSVAAAGGKPEPLAATVLTVLLILWNHRENVRSLRKGSPSLVFSGAAVSGKQGDQANEDGREA